MSRTRKAPVKNTIKEKTRKKISRSVKKTVKNKKALARVENKLQEVLSTSVPIKLDKVIPQQSIIKIIQDLHSGRPTEYDSSFVIKIALIMATGRTKENAAIILGINPITIYDWIKKEDADGNPNPRYKPEFSNAVKLGEHLNRTWWDETGKKNLNNKDFNNTLYMMFRQNLHGWTRKLEGKVDINETHTTVERKEVIFKFETEEIKQYIGELVDLGITVPVIAETE